MGSTLRLRIAAADVSLALSDAADSTILNRLPARIVSIDHREGDPQATIIAVLGEDGSGARIVARITRKSKDALHLLAGQAVVAQIKSAALVTSWTSDRP